VRIVFLLLAYCVGAIAAEEKKAELPAIPENVNLKTGGVLRKVKIIRWEKDLVVLKHAGGTDPVRFTSMSPEHRKIFEANRDAGLANEAAAHDARGKQNADEQAAYLAKIAWEERVKAAIVARSLLVGMTREEATASWGKPDKVNASGGAYGSREQWIYRERGRASSDIYVYFEGEKLTSWSN
jgi:hypothetical protein